MSNEFVSASNVSEQLAYWVGQTSQLSDSLIESQLRRSEAEAELERLKPFANRIPALEAECRTLSEQKADALVENNRLAEWAESMRSLTHRQEDELQRLRALSAQQETAIAALTAQLQSAQQSGTALTSAIQLQNAYAAKLASVETALAEAQKQNVEYDQLKFNYQILHAKYSGLKKSHSNFDDLTTSLKSDNLSYRHQMSEVCRELKEVRRDLLSREEERETLLTRLVRVSESEQELLSHNRQLESAVERLSHGARLARARIFQQIHQLRQFHQRIQKEAQAMIQHERRTMQQVANEIISHLHRSQSNANAESKLLQLHLRNDQETHQRQLVEQEEKMIKLLQYSASVASASNQLQHKRLGANSFHPSNSSNLAPSPVSLFNASTTIEGIAKSAAEFDVKQWLSKENRNHPTQSGIINTPINTSLVHLDQGQSSIRPHSTLSSSYSHTHIHSHPLASGQSPQSLTRQSLLVHNGYHPSVLSFANSIGSSIPSAPPSALTSALPSQQPSPTLKPLPTIPSNNDTNVSTASSAHMSEWQLDRMPSMAGTDLSEQLRLQGETKALARNVHVQRLIEVEAALQAMENVTTR